MEREETVMLSVSTLEKIIDELFYSSMIPSKQEVNLVKSVGVLKRIEDDLNQVRSQAGPNGRMIREEILRPRIETIQELIARLKESGDFCL